MTTKTAPQANPPKAQAAQAGRLHRWRGRHHRPRDPPPAGRRCGPDCHEHRRRQAQGRGRAARHDAAGRSRRALPSGRGGEGGGGAHRLARRRRAEGGRCQQRASRRRRLGLWLSGNGAWPVGRDQEGHARLQSGLLPHGRHRADPAAGGRGPPARRLPGHGQCGQRLQRRRAEHDRGLRLPVRRPPSSFTASGWSTSTCRSCRRSPG